MFRLISPKTVEMSMLRKSQGKRRLEELVISHGQFDAPDAKKGRGSKKNGSGTVSLAGELMGLFERESQMEAHMVSRDSQRTLPLSLSLSKYICIDVYMYVCT